MGGLKCISDKQHDSTREADRTTEVHNPLINFIVPDGKTLNKELTNVCEDVKKPGIINANIDAFISHNEGYPISCKICFDDK